MSEYFAMGGYAAFIWPAYALATVCLVGMVVTSRRTLKAREKEFEILRAARRGET